jgi:exopolysaccharide production protein ExoZ
MTTTAKRLPSGSRQLQNVQILRGLAAIMVVVRHGCREILEQDAKAPLHVLQIIDQKCLFAVDIFFVISGFIIFHMSRRKLEEPRYPEKFLLGRFFRILPLYWLVTGAMIALSLMAPQLKHNNSLRLDYILASLLFIPMSDPVTGAPQPLLGLGWTLIWEVFFYGTFAICMTVFRGRTLFAIIIILLMLFFTGAVPWVQQHRYEVIPLYWTHSLILEFLYGVVIAHIFSTKKVMPRWLGIGTILAGVAFWLSFGPEPGNFDWQGVIWGVPAALIVGGTVIGLRELRAYTSRFVRFAILLGDVSYSLYLLHLFAMRPVSLLLSHTGFHGISYSLVYFLLYVPAAVGMAYLSYRVFELPISHYSQKLIRAW